MKGNMLTIARKELAKFFLSLIHIWLTAALALLERGPSPCFPHALAVVRPWLADTAEGLLSETWGEAVRIAAGEEARRRLFAAFGLASAIDNEYH